MKAITFTALTAAAAAQQTTVFSDVALQINWNSGTSKVDFTVTMPNNQWFGIVLGSASTTSADALIWSTNAGSSTGVDYQFTATPGDAPAADTNDNVTTTVTENGDGTVTMVTSRSLSTGDVTDTDYTIALDTPFTCLFMYNAADNTVDAEPALQAVGEIEVPTDGTNAEYSYEGAMSLLSAAAASLVAMALF